MLYSAKSSHRQNAIVFTPTSRMLTMTRIIAIIMFAKLNISIMSPKYVFLIYENFTAAVYYCQFLLKFLYILYK